MIIAHLKSVARALELATPLLELPMVALEADGDLVDRDALARSNPLANLRRVAVAYRLCLGYVIDAIVQKRL